MRLRAELKKLAKKECANYDHSRAGNCLLETKPKCTECPFFNGNDDVLPHCTYFLKAVLPANEPLQYRYKQALGDSENGKICVVCKQPFSPSSNAQKYCHDCGEQVKRKQKARQGIRYRDSRRSL